MRAESQQYRSDLEQSYQRRGEALRQREETVDELTRQRREMEERELFVQRQALLGEVGQLREREAAFRQSSEASVQLGRVDAVRFERMGDELRVREGRLKQAEEEFERRLGGERERIKIDLDR